MSKRNLFLVGLMAVGKSTVGRSLADALGLEFLDSDRVIEKRAGAEIGWIFDVEGEEGFRERESQVIAELAARDGIVLATGGGVVLREQNRRMLKDNGIVIFLDMPIERLLERTRRDRRRPLLQDTSDRRALFERLARERKPLYESLADYCFCGDHGSPRGLAREIANRLRRDGYPEDE